MTKEQRAEIERQLGRANEAKDRLYAIAQELDALGAHRKARSCMVLIYNIEAWQNRGL